MIKADDVNIREETKQKIVGYTHCSKGYRTSVSMKEGKLCIGKPVKQRGILDKIFMGKEYIYFSLDSTEQIIRTNSDKENRHCQGSCLYDDFLPRTGLYTNFQTCDCLEGIKFLDGTVARAIYKKINIPNTVLK